MYCTQCGKQLPTDGQFCGGCGVSIVRTAPSITVPLAEPRRDQNNHPPIGTDSTVQMSNGSRSVTNKVSSFEVRWAWAIAIPVTVLGTVMFRNENIAYSLGNTAAGLTLGFLLSPIWWGISRIFSKAKWHWYHWFNSAVFTCLIIAILQWVFADIIQRWVSEELAVSAALPNATEPVISVSEATSPNVDTFPSVVVSEPALTSPAQTPVDTPITLVSPNSATSGTTTLTAPQITFAQFSTPIIYTGVRANVILTSEFDRAFRTRLRATTTQSPNFAAEYVLSIWGCGTGCAMGAAVNTRTGSIVGLPGSISGWRGEGENIIFKADSRLLILAGRINEEGIHGAHYFELKNGAFLPITTVPVPDVTTVSVPDKAYLPITKYREVNGSQELRSVTQMLGKESLDACSPHGIPVIGRVVRREFLDDGVTLIRVVLSNAADVRTSIEIDEEHLAKMGAADTEYFRKFFKLGDQMSISVYLCGAGGRVAEANEARIL